MAQETRVALLDLARRAPGVPVHTATELLGLDYSTVQYHVRVLGRHGALVCAPVGGVLRLYPPGAAPPREARPVLDALACETARDVANAVLVRGEATLREVVAGLGIPRTTAQDHLARLTRVGVLAAHREGPLKVYTAPRETPPVPRVRGIAS